MRGFGVGLLKGLGIAVAYGVTFYALKLLSPLTLNLPIGLRLAAFLLCPTRLWPWLVAGDIGASGAWAISAKYAHDFSWHWAVASTFFPFLAGIIPTALVRKLHGPVHFDVPLDVATFIGVALLGGALSAGVSTFVASLGGSAGHFKFASPQLPALFMMYVTGACTANLVLAPFLSAAKDLCVTGVREINGRRAAIYVGAASYIVLGALFLNYVDPAYLTIGRCGVFAPLVIVTMKRGWRGAACLMVVCCIALQITQRQNLEQDLLAVQNVASAAMAGILLFGSLITQQQLLAIATRNQVDNLASMVRRHSTRAEAQLQHCGGQLERMQRTVDEADLKFRDARDREEITQNWWATVKTLRRDLRNLSDMLHPRLLEEKGLRAAIAGGPLAQLLRNCDIEFDRHLGGRTSLLSNELQMSLYRLSYESACLLLRAGTPERIRLKLRIGRTPRGHSYAALRVTAHAEPDSWRPALGIVSTGLSLEAVGLIAESFEGAVDCSKDGHRITVVMYEGFLTDPLAAPRNENAALPMQRGAVDRTLAG